MCNCVFLLRQESFDMILINSTSFYDGGVTATSRRQTNPPTTSIAGDDESHKTSQTLTQFFDTAARHGGVEFTFHLLTTARSKPTNVISRVVWAATWPS
jgi:hypothetical protein